MASPRLRRQFEKLYDHFQGKNAEVQLEDITEILCCTRRNARMVLNKLSQENWIHWQPSAGRGKSSTLTFKYSNQDVSENLAKHYLESGRIEQALGVLDNDLARLTEVFQNYLGFSHNQGEHVIRLPYYRQLATLDPTLPIRRSEQHIIRQIFSGLTSLDKHENVCADLSHHWEMITPKHWRFYLRSGVRFHHGEYLKTQDVIDSLLALKTQALFSHIENVVSPAEHILDVYLSAPDHHLALLFTESQAKIIRMQDKAEEHFKLLPNGTGPYQVIRNDEQRLVLSAHDNYFGFRPLIDKVEVWVIDENHTYMIAPSLSKPISQTKDLQSDVELDPGCIYLLLNKRNGLAQSADWAQYFMSQLNSFQLMQKIPEPTILQLGLLHAHGLKPGWHHQQSYRKIQPPHTGARVKMAYQAQHPLFPIVAKAIELNLAEDGIELEKIAYVTEPKNCDDIDIWLKPMGVANYRDDALQGWLLGYSGLEEAASDAQFKSWKRLIEDWRAQPEISQFPAKLIAQQLVSSMQIIPLFHCWLGISQDHCGTLQNAHCNALGWFDFSQVWVRPEVLDIPHQ